MRENLFQKNISSSLSTFFAFIFPCWTRGNLKHAGKISLRIMKIFFLLFSNLYEKSFLAREEQSTEKKVNLLFPIQKTWRQPRPQIFLHNKLPPPTSHSLRAVDFNPIFRLVLLTWTESNFKKFQGKKCHFVIGKNHYNVTSMGTPSAKSIRRKRELSWALCNLKSDEKLKFSWLCVLSEIWTFYRNDRIKNKQKKSPQFFAHLIFHLSSVCPKGREGASDGGWMWMVNRGGVCC